MSKYYLTVSNVCKFDVIIQDTRGCKATERGPFRCESFVCIDRSNCMYRLV